jgi:hypothetical protein
MRAMSSSDVAKWRAVKPFCGEEAGVEQWRASAAKSGDGGRHKGSEVPVSDVYGCAEKHPLLTKQELVDRQRGMGARRWLGQDGRVGGSGQPGEGKSVRDRRGGRQGNEACVFALRASVGSRSSE